MVARSSAVVDACVALKWLFDDEEAIEQARHILDRWIAGELAFVQPPRWTLEVLNGIRSGVLRDRIPGAQAEQMVDDFLALEIPTRQLLEPGQVYRLARELNCSVYDAAYVQIAESRGLELITGDKKLYNAVHTAKPFVQLLAP